MIRRKFRSSRPELALFHTSAKPRPIRVRPGSPSTRHAPMQEPTMRTLGFRTHVLLTLLACGGVLAALGMPWSAGGPERESDGSIDQVIETLGGAVGGADGTGGGAGGRRGRRHGGPRRARLLGRRADRAARVYRGDGGAVPDGRATGHRS